MRWGDVDYKQLQKLRDNLQKLQDMDLDKFCEDVSKELAARLEQGIHRFETRVLPRLWGGRGTLVPRLTFPWWQALPCPSIHLN